ncbi:helix-turn-helix domain-containing protein [Paraburkholderia phenoliruptrix]|uniref:Helix-turn-helix domain-containing protein n=1 Tax=Paraburkholderia phenoliruptrix TaxID=252970 RepID=A0ABV3WIE6_9BURK
MAARLSLILGRNIATLRKRRRLTQADVAERIDVDAETISRFERGVVTPGISTLERLCSALGCAWSDLLESVSADAQQVGPEIGRLLEPLTPEDRRFLLDQIKVWAEKLGSR